MVSRCCFSFRLGECLHPGSGAGCCSSLFCSGFWVLPASCYTSRPCAACSAPLPCYWARRRHPRTLVWAPCLPCPPRSVACHVPVLQPPPPAPAVRAAGWRWLPSPLAPGRKPTVGLRCPLHPLGTAQRMLLPARFREPRHGFGLIQNWENVDPWTCPGEGHPAAATCP